jgi:hypothetical protein
MGHSREEYHRVCSGNGECRRGSLDYMWKRLFCVVVENTDNFAEVLITDIALLKLSYEGGMDRGSSDIVGD